jgi:hypothetical protein
MSDSWMSERVAAPYGHRTTPSPRICPAHMSVLEANPLGRRKVQSTFDFSINRSVSAWNKPIGSGCCPPADDR